MWVLIAGGITFFTGLGIPALWDQDEGFFAAAALEMHHRNDWIVPTFNGEMFGHKPPFMFWMMRLGYMVCGENELGARLFSAVFGLGAAVITFLLARGLFAPVEQDSRSPLERPSLWAGLVMVSCLMFGVVSRAATPDSYLVFWISVALLAYVRSVPEIWNSTDTTTSTTQQLLPRTWGGWFGIYGAMGVAVLVKGPIGILLPGATIGLFVILATLSNQQEAGSADAAPAGWKRIMHWLRGVFTTLPWRTAWAMHPFLAIAIVLLVAGPWFALVGWKTNGQFLAEFFGTHNFGRFMQPMDNHRGSILYYIPMTLAGFFPWSIFWIPTLLDSLRQLLARRRVDRAQLFLASWLIVVIGFFSLASTKLPSYVLPAYPALALLTASWVSRWIKGTDTSWSGWPSIAFGALMLVGVGMLTAIPALGWELNGKKLAHLVNLNEHVLAETLPLMLIGTIPLLCGGVCLWLWTVRKPSRSAVSLGVGSIAFCIALLAGGAIRIGQHQFTESIVQLANQAGDQTGVFGYFQPSMVFYSEASISRLATEQDVDEFLSHPGRTLIMTSQGKAALESEGTIPLDLEVVASRPNFPRPGELLLLRKASRLNHTQSASLIPVPDATPAIQPVGFEDRP